MAIFDIPETYFIVGQDILGHVNSLLCSLSKSDSCCILVVDNATRNISNICYVKNIDHTLLPVVLPLSKVANAKTGPEGV